jgi:hypothetical protein
MFNAFNEKDILLSISFVLNFQFWSFGFVATNFIKSGEIRVWELCFLLLRYCGFDIPKRLKKLAIAGKNGLGTVIEVS